MIQNLQLLNSLNWLPLGNENNTTYHIIRQILLLNQSTSQRQPSQDYGESNKLSMSLCHLYSFSKQTYYLYHLQIIYSNNPMKQLKHSNEKTLSQSSNPFFQ
jgi:hypothetical protein